MKRITQTLIEQTAQSSNISVGDNTLRNVKVLGLESENGRRYLLEAVQQALPMYEGVMVNIDHPEKSTAIRSLKDRYGKLVNVRCDNTGIWGDLKYNPKHPLAESIMWFAENSPECLGLSHNAEGSGYVEEGVLIVEKIENVLSVDLVADAATTKSLFEGVQMDDELMTDPDQGASEENYEEKLGQCIVAILQDDDLDLESKKKKVLQALKLLDDSEVEESEGEESEDEDSDKDKEKDEEQEDDKEKFEAVLAKSTDKNVKRLVEAYARLKHENKARRLCESHHIPATEIFIEALTNARTEEKMWALIEDRKAIVNRPRSTGRIAVSDDLTAKKLVETLRGDN